MERNHVTILETASNGLWCINNTAVRFILTINTYNGFPSLPRCSDNISVFIVASLLEAFAMAHKSNDDNICRLVKSI